ncbi:MAG: hypothetical protein DI611_15275 [Brachybacterium faecium]|nr:MAG: hypothetical protein DI611_15275 [Brachybacterium faecium]
MLVLMTAAPVPTHVAPLIRAARGLVARDHQVIIAVHESLHPSRHLSGIHFEPAGQDWISPMLGPLLKEPEISAATVAGLMERMQDEGFLGDPATSLAADVTALIARYRPDVIVRESYEYGGFLAAEAANIPLAVLGVTGMVSQFLPDAAVASAAGRWGVSPTSDSGADRTRGEFYAEFMPPTFDVKLAEDPAVYHFHRSHRPGPTNVALSKRPFVYVSLGTVIPLFKSAKSVLQTIVTALGEIDCTAVVVTGGLEVANRPANVHLVPRAKQIQLLDQADLFVTHCGYTSVQESTRAAVPMIGIPWIAENNLIANRAAELGLARVLHWETVDVNEVRDAVKAALEDAIARSVMRAYRESLVLLPGDDCLIDALEHVVEA